MKHWLGVILICSGLTSIGCRSDGSTDADDSVESPAAENGAGAQSPGRSGTSIGDGSNGLAGQIAADEMQQVGSGGADALNIGGAFDGGGQVEQAGGQSDLSPKAGEPDIPTGGASDGPIAGRASGGMSASRAGEPVLGGQPVFGGGMPLPMGGTLIPVDGMLPMGGADGSFDWSTEQVYEAMRDECGQCHSEGQALPYFATLTEFRERLVDDLAWIVPGAPEESGLLALLMGEGDGVFAQMPPGGPTYAVQAQDDPELPSIDDLRTWIERLPNEAPPEEPPPAACWDVPMLKALHRLNATEYNYAVRELTGTQSTPADDFPSDDTSYGFDHIAETLAVSPLLIEKYDLAAAALAEELMPPYVGGVQSYFAEGEAMVGTTGRESGTFYNLWSNGTLSGELTVEAPGDYRLVARVGGSQAGPDNIRFELLLNGTTYGPFETAAPGNALEVFELPERVRLNEGLQFVGVRFLNDYWCPADRFQAGECPDQGDRNMYIDYVELEGPLGVAQQLTPFQDRFFGECDFEGDAAADPCIRNGIERFAFLVYRRPLTVEEKNRIWQLVTLERDTAGGLRAGVRQAVHALLLSPNFLFKVESSGPEGTPLNGYERATRLANFLWRSVPDEALLARAGNGDLDDADGMAETARRMLEDERASALIEDFTGQWLMVRQVEVIDPDYELFPDFDEPLRAAMMEETKRVFSALWRSDRSILDLINADFTFVNARLATHYGFGDVQGNGFHRVDLPQQGRLGILTQAGWLSATSQRTRTSPVKRGKWVLEQLLCSEPPPPPPDVDGLPEEVDQNASLRERLEQHRADPNCAACHTNMDAVGFGLEQFDAIGAYREMDGDEVIEPAGRLMGEVDFEDAIDMAQAIRQHEKLGPCVTEKLLIYAMGRGLGEGEACYTASIEQAASASDFSAAGIVEAIVRHPIFTMRGRTLADDDAGEGVQP